MDIVMLHIYVMGALYKPFAITVDITCYFWYYWRWLGGPTWKVHHVFVYSMLMTYGSLLAVEMLHISTKTNPDPNHNLNRNCIIISKKTWIGGTFQVEPD